MKEAQRRVQALVQAERLRVVCTECECSKFNQAVAAMVKKRVGEIMKSSIVDAPSSSLPEVTQWLNYVFDANVKEKQNVLSKHKLALEVLLRPSSCCSIGHPPEDSKAWLVDAPLPIVTHCADETKMM